MLSSFLTGVVWLPWRGRSAAASAVTVTLGTGAGRASAAGGCEKQAAWGSMVCPTESVSRLASFFLLQRQPFSIFYITNYLPVWKGLLFRSLR